MGYAKGLRKVRKPQLPALLRRRKSKNVDKAKTEYEFRVIANPKEHTSDEMSWRFVDACNKSFETATTDDSNENNIEVPSMTDECNENSIEVPSPIDGSNENSVSIEGPSQSTRFGWLFTACLGDTLGANASATASTATIITKEDSADEDLSLGASSYDDDSGESSVPSMSRINQVLKVNRSETDDVSEITMVPSVDEDESDDEESIDSEKTICSQDNTTIANQALEKANGCTWWPVG